jgi:hypothetical protein
MGRSRFDGLIAGIGTASGTRLVIGMWARTPLGPIVDAMVETADGHRVLVAPREEVADYIAATYRFDEIRVEPTTLALTAEGWTVGSPSLHLTAALGRRTAVGRLLRLVPAPVARSPWWCRTIDPAARMLRPGVRTVGSAGGGRREFYCAFDERAIASVDAAWDGAELGALRPVTPPVRFGFGSSPRRPALVRVTTLIDEPDAMPGR